jgi:hypothetical protein
VEDEGAEDAATGGVVEKGKTKEEEEADERE